MAEKLEYKDGSYKSERDYLFDGQDVVESPHGLVAVASFGRPPMKDENISTGSALLRFMLNNTVYTREYSIYISNRSLPRLARRFAAEVVGANSIKPNLEYLEICTVCRCVGSTSDRYCTGCGAQDLGGTEHPNADWAVHARTAIFRHNTRNFPEAIEPIWRERGKYIPENVHPELMSPQAAEDTAVASKLGDMPYTEVQHLVFSVQQARIRRGLDSGFISGNDLLYDGLSVVLLKPVPAALEAPDPWPDADAYVEPNAKPSGAPKDSGWPRGATLILLAVALISALILQSCALLQSGQIAKVIPRPCDDKTHTTIMTDGRTACGALGNRWEVVTW